MGKNMCVYRLQLIMFPWTLMDEPLDDFVAFFDEVDR